MSRFCLAGAILCALGSGCRTTPVARDNARPLHSSVESRSDQIACQHHSNSDDEPSIILTTSQSPDDNGANASPLAGSLSLTECIAVSLAQNPDLITMRQTEAVSMAALGVAETYPFNPFVQVQATPYQANPLPDHGTTYHYVLLMQQIQLAHQQQFREEGAVSTLNSTRWNIHQAELLNVAQTQRLYFNVLYQRGLLELAKASDDNNRQLLTILEKQLKAGQATAADVAIVRTDARSTSQQARLARANYETAVRDLKRQLGCSPDDSTVIEGDLRHLAWKHLAADNAGTADVALRLETVSRASLMSSRAASRPDVMAAHSDVDAARAARCLATANRTPDVQIGPYYQRTADGMSYLGFRAQMDIPVVNSGIPLEQQRMSEFNQRVVAWQQLLRRAELESQAAAERYVLALSSLSEDSPQGVDDVPQELESLERQFVAGEVDVIRVVQARISIIQSQRARLDLLNEVAQSAANLTAASGMAIEELLQ